MAYRDDHKRAQEPIELEVWIHGETEKAFHISAVDGTSGKVWVAKSLGCKIVSSVPGARCPYEAVMEVPYWLADREGLA